MTRRVSVATGTAAAISAAAMIATIIAAILMPPPSRGTPGDQPSVRSLPDGSVEVSLLHHGHKGAPVQDRDNGQVQGNGQKNGPDDGRKPRPSPSRTASPTPSAAPSPTPSVPGTDDPHLKSGWPAYAFSSSGAHQGGPDMHVLVGEIDGDPELEVIVTARSTGPLYAFDPDGTPLPGWPVRGGGGSAYPALGDLTPGDGGGLDVAMSYWGSAATWGRVAAVRGDGSPVPGRWPSALTTTGTTRRAPVITDLNGDGEDEVLVDLHNEAYALDRHGQEVPWWLPPLGGGSGGDPAQPSVADLDGDGRKEVVVYGQSTPDMVVWARQLDGTQLPGFPLVLPNQNWLKGFSSIGDVTGDNRPELVLTTKEPGTIRGVVHVIDPRAARVLTTMRTVSMVPYFAQAALADLDGDGVRDIIVQSDKGLDAWRGDGSPLPSFPIPVGDQTYGAKADGDPVIGDVTGDGRPDIVLVAKGAEANTGKLFAFDATGRPLPGFPKATDGGLHYMPAIADLDRDGHNEIIAAGMRLDFVRQKPLVWVWDLGQVNGGGPHGPVMWGQHKGGPRHEGVAGASWDPPPRPAPQGTATGSARRVADLVAGAGGSAPRELVAFGGGVAFSAWRADVGRELFLSDGTDSGTRLVKDIAPGVRGGGVRDLTVAAGVLYFAADDGVSGRELWRSDGTSAGTWRVADIVPGRTGSRPEWLTALGNRLYFSADDGVNGRELWRSDGTAAGTILFADLTPGWFGGEPKDLVTFDGLLYLQGYGYYITSDGYTIGSQYLYSVDQSGVMRRDDEILAGDPEPAYHYFTWSGPLFTDGDMVWRVGGPTVAGVVCGERNDNTDNYINLLSTDAGVTVSGGRGLDRDCAVPLIPAFAWVPPIPAPRELTNWSGAGWFAASNAGAGRELWRTDGTAEGSVLVTDLRAGAADSDPQQLTPDGSRLLLVADDDAAGRELWAVTPAGAGTRLTDIWPGRGGSGIDNLTRTAAGWFFTADDPSGGRELWTIAATP